MPHWSRQPVGLVAFFLHTHHLKIPRFTVSAMGVEANRYVMFYTLRLHDVGADESTERSGVQALCGTVHSNGIERSFTRTMIINLSLKSPR